MSRKISRYEIISEIGSGGFSTVYAAHDPSLDRQVAVKVMRPMLMSDPDFALRFQREAQVAANLDHPGIVPIYDYGEFEGNLFLVMKLYGSSLSTRLEKGPLDWPTTITLVSQVAASLDFAHARDLFHRDIKPDNILLEEDANTAVVADFGIVKALGRSTITLTLSQGILGTPPYIAPEIWNGLPASPASDNYALACVVFEMATGEKLFEAPTPPATMTLHFRPPQYPEQWPEGVPPGLEDVLNTALARDPEMRYLSASAFADALSKLELDPLAEEYVALNEAIAEEDWPQAVVLAEAILTENANYKDVADLLQQSLEAKASQDQANLARQWRAQAREALGARNWATAIAASQQWLRLVHDDEALRIIQQAKKGQEAEAKPPTSPAAPVIVPEERASGSKQQEKKKPALQRYKKEPTPAKTPGLPGWAWFIIGGIVIGFAALVIALGIAGQTEPEYIEFEVTRVVTEVEEVLIEVTRVVTEVEEVLFEVTRVVEVEVCSEPACPFVYTFDPDTQSWTFDTTIIYDLVGPESEREQRRRLSNFDGRLIIREVEPETSYLDHLYVIVQDSAGEETILRQHLPLLQEADKDYLILNQGEEVVLIFDAFDELSDIEQVWVVAQGYYVPY